MPTILTAQEVTEVIIKLTPAEAGRLYDDISNALDALEVFGASSRHKRDLPAIYVVFDLLYHVGVPSEARSTEPYSLSLKPQPQTEV